MREFNVTGLCVPEKHYMADTSKKITAIMELVNKGRYFSINCARQYGKTTMLNLLEKNAPKEYTMIKLSFEGVSDIMFETEKGFCQSFIDLCARYFRQNKQDNADIWKSEFIVTFDLLNEFLSKICRDKKYVLLIDEVDKASNNLIFLKFLGMLRNKYLSGTAGDDYTFHSVILAGVYNVKNLKVKMIQAGTHELVDSEKRLNSPWNIAVDFKVDMSFSEQEISTMLSEYEKDHNTGMDIESISKEIRTYTSGYPYLVSRICQKIEEDLNKEWTSAGLKKAVRMIVIEQSTLFDDIFKNIKSNLELQDLLYSIIINGRTFSFNSDNYGMELGLMFGILSQDNEKIAIHNRIFEIRITNYFATEKEIQDSKLLIRTNLSNVVIDKKLNMSLLIEKFANHYYEIYHKKDISFLERECRLLFITFLRPYINGVGFYHLESETRNGERTDLIIDFYDQQFIIELKLWYGEASHEKALDQITSYLNSKNNDTGYLLTFDFRKENNTGAAKFEWIEHKGKNIFDVMVGI